MSRDPSVYKGLAELFAAGRVKLDVPMKDLTTMRVGGPVDALVTAESTAELKTLVRWANERQIPLMVLGRCSNLIVRDGGLRGVAVRLGREFGQIRVDGNFVRAGAAASLRDVSRAAAEAGLTGAEFACGIPGSLGGAVFMNAGAYGPEMKDVIDEVEVLNLKTGEVETCKGADCEFRYRGSRFKAGGYLILSAVLRLAPGDKDAIFARMGELDAQRAAKQPLEMPSAGSVFKRPEGYFVGALVDAAGLRGYRIGGAQVSAKHSGFIVNAGGATAADILSLIAHVQKVVLERKGVHLEPEVCIIGEEA
jgi:UDP-N-acetylmuramate dehydrogenase